ncbi:MAG: aconitase X [Candidatus Limnocylindrales bacterium]
MSILDLVHPERFRRRPEVATAGREMMRLYVEMGCLETWPCAPYQLVDRPGFGEQIAWAECERLTDRHPSVSRRPWPGRRYRRTRP